MGVASSRRKCRCCRRMYDPDYRNGHHQRYCSAPACRRASHLAAQRKWRRKPENRDHFRGPDEVRRVQEWRAAHPGYWKQKSPPDLSQQPPPPQQVNPEQSSRNSSASPRPPLQDVCLSENPVFIGLISLITGTTLQDDIAATARQLLRRGENILGLTVPEPTPVSHDRQTPDSSRAPPPRAQRL